MNDAGLERQMQFFSSFLGASLLFCCVLTVIFDEYGPYRNHILAASLCGGGVLACWLDWVGSKKMTLQKSNEVVK